MWGHLGHVWIPEELIDYAFLVARKYHFLRPWMNLRWTGRWSSARYLVWPSQTFCWLLMTVFSFQVPRPYWTTTSQASGAAITSRGSSAVRSGNCCQALEAWRRGARDWRGFVEMTRPSWFDQLGQTCFCDFNLKFGCLNVVKSDKMRLRYFRFRERLAENTTSINTCKSTWKTSNVQTFVLTASRSSS